MCISIYTDNIGLTFRFRLAIRHYIITYFIFNSVLRYRWFLIIMFIVIDAMSKLEIYNLCDTYKLIINCQVRRHTETLCYSNAYISLPFIRRTVDI